jgi:hypothetical protein
MRPSLLTQPLAAVKGTCPIMQQFIEQLVSKHQVDVSVAGVQLWLALPGTKERLLIAGLSGQRISITHCIADADDQLVCDTDLVFLVAEVGWQPLELLHTETVWADYVQRMAATGSVQVFDEAGEIRLPSFAESWASTLEQQRWLDKSQRLRI